MQPRAAVLLRGWRVGAGLSPNAAAKRFLTDRDTYVRWEEGKSVPTLPFLARIEDQTGISMRAWLESDA